MTEKSHTEGLDCAEVVLELFASVVGRAAPRGLDTSPGDVPEWDSLAHIHLVHAVERRAGRRLPEQQLVATRTMTLRALAEAF